MPSINVEAYVGYIDVDVDLDDFDTDDLKEELERRGQPVVSNEYVTDLLKTVYEKRRLGQNFDYELDEFIYQTLGRVT